MAAKRRANSAGVRCSSALWGRSSLWLTAPRFDLSLRVFEIDKRFFVEALVAELAVEALDEAVLLRLAGMDEIQMHAVAVRPGIKLSAGKFGAIVGGEGRGAKRFCKIPRVSKSSRFRTMSIKAPSLSPA